MKKLLLIIGIVFIAACVLILLYAALNFYGYRHVLDGSPELYDRLHRRAITFFTAGIVFAVLGAACVVIRSRI